MSMFEQIIARQIKSPEGREQKPDELHPLVLDLLCNTYHITGATLNFEDIPQIERFANAYGAIRQFAHILPPERFQELIVAFATGLQFAINFHQGETVDNLTLDITNRLPRDIMVVCDTTSYVNITTNERIVESKINISREQLLNYQDYENGGNASFGSGHTPQNDLNLYELMMAFGAEEMDHAVRHQAAIKANNRMSTADELTAIEDAARVVVDALVEAYSLGRSRRGHSKK